MQILEELGTFVVALALAVALIGIAAVMLYYFNPQQPVDHAKAAFYPLVRPLNETHVWLGVKPFADKVEVVELKYQHNGSWFDVPVARLTADRTVWLNATDGRPVAVPCTANVTVATRHGTASRAVSFTPVCLQRQPQIREDLTVLLQQKVSYGSYVLDYAAYKSTPVLTAYFGFVFTHVYWDYVVGSGHIGFQNVGPFPYMAAHGAPAGGGLWPPSAYAVSLTPGEHRNIGNIPSGELWLSWPNGVCPGRVCGVMYRWLNVYVYWNDTLEIWINNVRVYNGTPPASAAEYTAPQGFTVTFDPGAGALTIKYRSIAYICDISWCSVFGWTQRTALTLSVVRGNATQWSGWVEMINTRAPTSPVSINQPWSVMPAGPYAGRSGGLELFGVVPPFEVHSVYAAVNGSGLVVRVGDPNCGVSERCIRTFFYPQPGAYQIDTGINTPAGVPVYIDQNYIIAVTSTFRDAHCSRCATIGWHVPGVKNVMIYNPGSSGEDWWIGTGPYRCIIWTNGFRNTVAFEGRYWQIECGYYEGWPPQWKSLGVIRLVFNSDRTVSVYKDGQYLYNVRVDVCTRFPCVGAPTQRVFIPVVWGPDGVAVGVAQFRHNRHSVGYGEGVVRVRDMQTVALPFYYRYNLTGAYPYRLEVQIDTAEKKVAEADGWIYVNVTYSGYLKLYLGDQLAAYDALYGWTIRLDRAPPPAEGEVSDRPDEACVPQKVRKPKGVEHRNLVNGTDGYSVQVVKKYEVREFGCGADRKYTEAISAGVYTATGTSYHVKDPNNKVCGFKQAHTCNGVVYCDECS
jgi:hypothetical protein